MTRMRRCATLLLCLALLPLTSLTAAAETPAPNVRVLLRRLELTDRADLVLDGVYTAENKDGLRMSFPEGAEVTLLKREGEMYLFYEGLHLCVGQGVTLKRHASRREMPGIRFEKTGTLYPGDLRMTIENGVLTPVLTLSVEDYLLGVVPYEMSDSFPLEALKAQAVCARTYALSHVSPDRAYDVVDTTNDQVFKGVDPSHVNAAQAVKETAGVVGTYKGKLAECYYSASNGGQTELVENVWPGDGDYGYYAMADDPYDLENPASVVRTARIAKKGDVSEAVKGLIHQALLPELKARGFDERIEHFRVDEVASVTLAAPVFKAPSRRMSEIVLTVTASGRVPQQMPSEETEEHSVRAETPSPSAEPVLGPLVEAVRDMTVTLPVNRETLTALKLNINQGANELLEVEETETHFLLKSRRYGHGVGMSQRGAQWMASAYGKSFTEILSFYYPGMELRQTSKGTAALSTAPAVLAATAAPPATPTPRPTLMPVTVQEGEKVMQVGASTLNLRAEPTLAGELLMRLMGGQRLVVLETCEDPAWVKVRTDVTEGYVMVQYLSELPSETPAAAQTLAPAATPAP